MPDASSTASVSRRCPGPSATTTEDAPRRRSVFAAATTRRGSVLIEEPAAYSTRFGLRSTERPRTSGFDDPQAVEQQALEVAVVALGPEHRDGRLPRLGELRAVERRRRVEDAEPVGGDRASGAEPGGRERRRGRSAVGGSCSRARPQRLEERVRPGREGGPGQGERTAGADGPRHEPPERLERGGERPRRGGAGRARSARASARRARDATRRRGSAAPAPRASCAAPWRAISAIAVVCG